MVPHGKKAHFLIAIVDGMMHMMSLLSTLLCIRTFLFCIISISEPCFVGEWAAPGSKYW